MSSPITPDALAASGTEQGIQRAVLHALNRDVRPQFRVIDALYHVPNGGYRGDKKDAAIAGNNLKMMGAKSGVPDLCIPFPRLGYGALYVEIKLPSGKLKQEQVAFIKLLQDAGNFIAVLDDWREIANLIRWYLFGDKSSFESLYGAGAIFDPKDRMNNPEKSRRRK